LNDKPVGPVEPVVEKLTITQSEENYIKEKSTDKNAVYTNPMLNYNNSLNQINYFADMLGMKRMRDYNNQHSYDQIVNQANYYQMLRNYLLVQTHNFYK
jgi:hypothetical protein